MHASMLTMISSCEIGPDVPVDGTSGYDRSMFLAIKKTLAGRSPSLRMK